MTIMLHHIWLSAEIIVSSGIIAFLLIRLFKTPIQAVWNCTVIALCNFMLIALLAVLILMEGVTHVPFLCFVIIISMVIFTLITARVTQISNKRAANIVALFVLLDVPLVFIIMLLDFRINGMGYWYLMNKQIF